MIMKKFIKVDNTNPKKAKVMYINYVPYDEVDGISEKELKSGYLVDSLPEPENRDGYVPVLFLNTETMEFWYEYEKGPINPMTVAEQLKEQLLEMQSDNLNYDYRLTRLELGL